MILKRDSVNITTKNLIENAVRLLVNAESIDDYDWASSLSEIAQGYLRAAELMQNADEQFIDLGQRFHDR